VRPPERSNTEAVVKLFSLETSQATIEVRDGNRAFLLARAAEQDDITTSELRPSLPKADVDEAGDKSRFV
jgi:hypothetical protein